MDFDNLVPFGQVAATGDFADVGDVSKGRAIVDAQRLNQSTHKKALACQGFFIHFVGGILPALHHWSHSSS
jgi:hypothetical protein